MKLKTYRMYWIAGYSAFCILFSIFGMWLAKIEYGYRIDTFLSLVPAIAIAGIIPFGLLYYAPANNAHCKERLYRPCDCFAGVRRIARRLTRNLFEGRTHDF